ncbi:MULTISPECIES: hypothetical protein [unclassified Streptomyces]|uniref:hypothetical protein n=1 Tax=unclassified Streptomyces TaxID=2593676 RepID=UPI0011642FE1|nr:MULTISPECIES: hypothetical protein [unclassified Streptomyces]QDN54963.1 hypothetical protein FNV67_05950 [Streptomyces sp. S1D4-20]
MPISPHLSPHTPPPARSSSKADSHGTHPGRIGLFSRRGRFVNAARVPGLVLPLVYLCGLVAVLAWYWRHRGE